MRKFDFCKKDDVILDSYFFTSGEDSNYYKAIKNELIENLAGKRED